MVGFDKDMHVLLLSHVKEHAELMLKSLKKINVTKVTIMDNGIEALQKMAEEKYGFLLCDQNIRFISGWLLIKEIKTSEKIPNIPVILFGKEPLPESEETLKRYGLIKYLQLPVQTSDLEFTLHSTLSLFHTSGTLEHKYTKAKDSLISQKPKEAIELYAELRGLTKNSARSSIGLAQAFLQDHQDQEANKVMEELSKSDEDSPARSLLQAKIAFKKQDSKLALQQIQHILAQVPNGFYFSKCVKLLMEFQHIDLAAPLAQKALSLEFQRPEFYLCLAKDRYNEGAMEGSLAFIEQHAKTFGMTSELYNLKGVCYKKTGDHAKALQSYEQALKLSPTDARVYFNMAMCEIQMKRNDEAIRSLEQCLKYSPQFPKAQEKLDELKKRALVA